MTQLLHIPIPINTRYQLILITYPNQHMNYPDDMYICKYI